jgi:hypothetical protein
MMKSFVHIILSIILVYLSTLSTLSACCCINLADNEQTTHPCHNESSNSVETAPSASQCQCEQNSNNNLLSLLKPHTPSIANWHNISTAYRIPLYSHTTNSIYRPPIFIKGT